MPHKPLIFTQVLIKVNLPRSFPGFPIIIPIVNSKWHSRTNAINTGLLRSSVYSVFTHMHNTGRFNCCYYRLDSFTMHTIMHSGVPTSHHSGQEHPAGIIMHFRPTDWPLLLLVQRHRHYCLVLSSSCGATWPMLFRAATRCLTAAAAATEAARGMCKKDMFWCR